MIMDDFGAVSNLSATPRDSISSVGFSFSSGSSISNSGSSSSISIKTAINDCTAAWINYLNVLNNLCSAGSKLAHTIAVLEQFGFPIEKTTRLTDKTILNAHPTSYLINSWNDLARASAVATSTIKTHITAVLQDFVPLPTLDQSVASNCELEQKRVREHNELIILENAQTMINIQHQFCAASYDAFSSLTCCFICQSPVGYPHEQDCTIAKQRCQHEQRSETPSPNFCGSYKIEPSRGNSITDQRTLPVGITEPATLSLDQPCGPAPQQNRQVDINPMQAIFENIRGPLPNPGHLLSMKIPFYRGPKSALSFPLFPLHSQRRWSEAAAGEVIDNSLNDAESQMRRWSMPWEASKSEQNTVTWNQTRIMPMNALRFSYYKMPSLERCYSNTPDTNWQTSLTSQDGLTEAIQLLSFKPLRIISTPLQTTAQSHGHDGTNLE